MWENYDLPKCIWYLKIGGVFCLFFSKLFHPKGMIVKSSLPILWLASLFICILYFKLNSHHIILILFHYWMTKTRIETGALTCIHWCIYIWNLVALNTYPYIQFNIKFQRVVILNVTRKSKCSAPRPKTACVELSVCFLP